MADEKNEKLAEDVLKKYDKEFKLGVLDYVHRHRELTIYECSQHFGVGYSTLSRWLRQERSDKVAECNRLQQELQEEEIVVLCCVTRRLAIPPQHLPMVLSV